MATKVGKIGKHNTNNSNLYMQTEYQHMFLATSVSRVFRKVLKSNHKSIMKNGRIGISIVFWKWKIFKPAERKWKFTCILLYVKNKISLEKT